MMIPDELPSMIPTWSSGSGGEVTGGNAGPGYPVATQPASNALSVFGVGAGGDAVVEHVGRGRLEVPDVECDEPPEARGVRRLGALADEVDDRPVVRRIVVRVGRVERQAGRGRGAQRGVARGSEACGVRGRDEVLEVVRVAIARRRRARRRAWRVDEVPDGDREGVAVRAHPGATDHLPRRHADRTSERVPDRVADGDPDVTPVDEDAVDQIRRVARMAALVDLGAGSGGKRRGDAVRRGA